jgi:RNA polymerase sigma-70 factor (ECF subfamily)
MDGPVKPGHDDSGGLMAGGRKNRLRRIRHISTLFQRLSRIPATPIRTAVHPHPRIARFGTSNCSKHRGRCVDTGRGGRMGGVAGAVRQAATAVPAESDDALVARACAGDKRAFAALVARHYPMIHRLAWRCCGDRTEAEDIAQEVCVRIARALTGFEGRSSFPSWLYGITLNAARDAGRARSRRAVAMQEAAVEAEIEAAAAADDGDDEALWQAVRGLPPRQRDAVMLVHVEGLTHREAADALGCAEATVSWHLFAARRQLKTMLARAS